MAGRFSFKFSVGGRYGTVKAGKTPIGGKVQLIEEAKKNLEAVINRLHRYGQYDMAEEIFDLVTKSK